MKRTGVSLFMAALLSVIVAGVFPVAAAGSVKYTVTLKPTGVKNSKGTPITTGSGTATLTLYSARKQICYAITVKGLKLPATHTYIKSLKKGSVGTTVASLGTPGSSGTANGCTRSATRNTIKSIESSPKSYYVIVQTTDYPVGALRGTI